MKSLYKAGKPVRHPRGGASLLAATLSPARYPIDRNRSNPIFSAA
jgi:hypothetical protein